MPSPWLIAGLLFAFLPSLPPLKPSQLAQALPLVHRLSWLVRSTGVPFDLLAVLFILPASLYSRRQLYPARILLILNTYIGLRALLNPPFSIFSSVPFSATSAEIHAIIPPGAGGERLDELITRLSNIETRECYVRFGHETMMNTPSLGSWMIILATYIAFQLPIYLLYAGLLAATSSLSSPSSNPTSRTNPSITRAWFMIITSGVFMAELFWTTSTVIEAATPSSRYPKRSSVEIQPPIYEIAYTARTIFFLALLPIMQYFVLSQSSQSISLGGTSINPSPPQAVIHSSAQALNNAVSKLRHLGTLHRLTVVEPRMTDRWKENTKHEAQSVATLLSSPSLAAVAADNDLSFQDNEAPLRVKSRGIVANIVKELNQLLSSDNPPVSK